ncbi:reticulon-2 [Bombina bombina]|uniref:reticulon-2 n=1 Tax=Bombina bombina TaxID=8345 RepID=UPI00235A7017|nr:reticulon-2 [Bombina bombina]
MGHVLSFTHCKDAPSTASSTPDSCPPNGDADELTVTPVELWPTPTPQEPTFSYITIGGYTPLTRPPVRPRRGCGQRRGSLKRKGSEMEEDQVSFVLLEEACKAVQALPMRSHEEEEEEEEEFVEQLHPRIVDSRAAVGLRVYAMTDEDSWQWSLKDRANGANPFQQYLDTDITPTTKQMEALTARILSLCCSALVTLRALFFVQDLKESLKFLLLLYLLTYVGAVLNGITLLLLVVIGSFTFPILYKQHQVKVDHYVSLVTKQLRAIRAKIRANIRRPPGKQS